MAGTKWRVKTEAEQIAEIEIRRAKARATMAKLNAQRRFRYRDILSLIRKDTEHQGQLARIALFKQGYRPENRWHASKEKARIQFWLDKNYPMENWRLTYREVPETWGQYEIRVAYFGLFESEKEAKAAREARKIRAGVRTRRARKARSG